MSAAGGVQNALHAGNKIGASVIQIFTANQRRWSSKIISSEETVLWKQAKKETGITHVMSHASYLINMGSGKPDLLKKSIKAFEEELHRCHTLDIDYVVFHPGSAVNSDEDSCLDRIVTSLLTVVPVAKKGNTRILLETTAGQGSNIGYKFEQLGHIIKKTHKHLKIGVCIDTCHIFAAGYDIRTPAQWNTVLKDFDEKIGLNYLYAFHLNDSAGDLGEKKDRHANLGYGKIGTDCFKFLMTNAKTKNLPKYLETPHGDKFWKNEIKMLKKFAGEKE